MADQRNGGISWTDETWNPIRGCQRVNDDCRNCYAERIAATRLSGPGQPYHGLAMLTPDGPRWTGDVTLDVATLMKPLRWGRPRLVFVNGMSDLFINQLTDAMIDRVVDVMAETPQHTYQVLTKRPARMVEYLYRAAERWQPWPLPNVWWGASMGHRKAVQSFMPELAAMRHHAAVLWVSAEPLIESAWDYLDFEPWLWKTCPTCDGSMSVPVRTGGAPCGTCLDHQGVVPAGLIDWMVAGGESGQGARPTNLAVARQLRDDCLEAGVPFHWKQWGEWLPANQVTAGNHGATVHEAIVNVASHRGPNYLRVGKKAAGRLLDGKLWDAWPKGYSQAGRGI